ncbi:MAG: KUP/HAK/KT family potassium transporter [Methanospirillum sp.]|uniref:KUP/HAK/KT family potassium transporter n=1 Tax=Methanospirillum sp. TaxID=45200 RepID=UPI00236F6648|nr:KUP/HAK/KT family potassium transporter [Methanospirillum sp.]MDD1727866.1 KUP/HAK/KT family potassium transporter [Methanospirillum sp.]
MENIPPVSSIIKATGLVFGDIGTSPIYTLAVLFALIPPTEEDIMGLISLIFWTLTILVSLQYAFLAMRLSHNGEGGTIVLKEILSPMLKHPISLAIVTLIATLGISLMIGDCVITPAISILSAVEGIKLVPVLGEISQGLLITIAILITLFLFWSQKRGTEKIAAIFGPVMILWFIVLLVTGLYSLIQTPQILFSLSPSFALRFFVDNPIDGFLSLSLVILCATGGEALFADMGHLGREPIRWAWIFVFIAILISYLGQGAYLLRTGNANNPLFEMIYSQASFLYIPFLLVMIMATVIASQAVISGIFSVTFQAISTHLLPMLHIDYTSSHLRTQIYIDAINWMLCIAVILMLLIFQYSERLAEAYGIAVTGTMLITGILMTAIFLHKNQRGFFALSVLVTLVDLAFFISMLTKVPAGGFWSLIIASVPFSVIIIYTHGQKMLYHAMHPMDWKTFRQRYAKIYKSTKHITGTAVFFARSVDRIPPYISRTIFTSGILYEKTIIVSMNSTENPFGIESTLQPDLEPGLSILTISRGYMEVIDLMQIIHRAGIEERTIFYGMEEIVSRKIGFKLFYLIKRICPSFVQYYRLPAQKVHGVITRIEL